MPLILRGKTIGALTVQSRRMAAFTSQDLPGFQLIADQLANAIENARLYADAHRQATELAAAYAQLKELDRLKDQFMQNVSHELRTPLTIISGYAEFMATGAMGELDSDQEEAVQAISRSAHTLTGLVSDIIAILEAQESTIRPVPLSLMTIGRESLSDFRQTAAEKDIDLQAEWLTDDHCPSVVARYDHIRRVFDNLLSNALKFTPAGGTVTLRLENLSDHLLIQVIDTGIGVPPHLQSRIFDRFFQVDGTIRREFGGTGLGLALVKEFVELYGGSVSVFSAGENQGSTFAFTLPVVAV